MVYIDMEVVGTGASERHRGYRAYDLATLRAPDVLHEEIRRQNEP